MVGMGSEQSWSEWESVAKILSVGEHKLGVACVHVRGSHIWCKAEAEAGLVFVR